MEKYPLRGPLGAVHEAGVILAERERDPMPHFYFCNYSSPGK